MLPLTPAVGVAEILRVLILNICNLLGFKLAGKGITSGMRWRVDGSLCCKSWTGHHRGQSISKVGSQGLKFSVCGLGPVTF